MKNELAFNLRNLRNKYGYSQQIISDGFNMTRAKYSSYEEARAEPNINMLKRIADFYEITIDELCFKKLKL